MDKNSNTERFLVSFPAHVLATLDELRAGSGLSRSAMLAYLVDQEQRTRQAALYQVGDADDEPPRVA